MEGCACMKVDRWPKRSSLHGRWAAQARQAAPKAARARRRPSRTFAPALHARRELQGLPHRQLAIVLVQQERGTRGMRGQRGLGDSRQGSTDAELVMYPAACLQGGSRSVTARHCASPLPPPHATPATQPTRTPCVPGPDRPATCKTPPGRCYAPCMRAPTHPATHHACAPTWEM